MSTAGRKLRVCVIGAGAAGLCALRHLSSDPTTFEITAYEQSSHIGGTWVYNESAGVHSSMYANLRTNLPGEIMNFPDWRKMGGGGRSCLTHAEVLSYLEDYANHFELRKYITLNSRIKTVQPDNQPVIASSAPSSLGGNTWKVKVKNMTNQTTEEREFDVVICSQGNLCEPNIPSIPGIQTFSGKVLHSHDYRRPQPFAGKTIVVLGAASSGVDIGIELAEYARHVYLSHNMPRISSALPSNMTQEIGVAAVEGNRFLFKDGTSVLADAFVYCTGYKYSFPFLDESCKMNVEDKYIHPVYRHLINVEYPTMCFLGIPRIVVPFPMFHLQVQYFIAVLKGNVALPSKEIMLEDSVNKAPVGKHAHRLAEAQWAYFDSLATDGHLDPLPPIYKAGYEAWTEHRKRNLWHYKEANFLVAADGESAQIVFNDNNTNN